MKRSLWPTIFTAALVIFMGFAIAGPIQEVKSASTVILLFFCLCVSVFAPLDYAAAGAVACLPVHSILTQSLGLVENPIPGLNVGCIWTGLMLLVFFTRYRIARFTKPERMLVILYGMLILCRVVATYRGPEEVFSDYFAVVWGSAQVGCAFLWLRHTAKILPWKRSCLAAVALGIGPVIAGCSMIPQVLSGDYLVSTRDMTMARITGLMDPNAAAVGLVIALLFLSGAGATRHGVSTRQVLVLFAAILCVILSGSRTALFALLVAIAILLFQRHKALLLLGACAVWSAISVASRFAPAIYDRFTRMDTDSGLANSRAVVFFKAWSAFLEHPLVGSGRDTYRYSTGDLAVAHNTLLAFLAEGGLIYGAVWLLLVWYLFKAVSHPGRELTLAGHTAMAIVAAFFVASNGILIDGMDYHSVLVAGYAGCFLGALKVSQVSRHSVKIGMTRASLARARAAGNGYPDNAGSVTMMMVCKLQSD